MMREIQPGSGSRVPWRQLLLIAALCFGTVVRLLHLGFVGVDTPFHLGGLFVEFSQQIAAHGFRLPARIPLYTDGGIPFAYPPLPFYLEAFLLSVLSLPKFTVVNLLPPLIAIMAIHSFYLLTRQLAFDASAQLFALWAYATMPVAFQQQIEGGGLAESVGSLSLIWFAISLVRARSTRTAAGYAQAGVFWAISVLASPGSAYASVPTALILAPPHLGRRVQTTGLLALAGGIAIALTAPYWLTVVMHHGVRVFTDSFIAQHVGLVDTLKGFLINTFTFQVSSTRFSLFWNLCVFAGVLWEVFDGRWWLPVWFSIMFNIPREGDWLVSAPAALLAGIGGARILQPQFHTLARNVSQRPAAKLAACSFVAMVLLFGVVWCPLRVIKGMLQDDEESLSASDLAAMQWVSANIPPESEFVVLAPPGITEWFPQIARRTVLNTPFGAEWKPREAERINTLDAQLSDCLDWDCVEATVQRTLGHDGFYLCIAQRQFARLAAASAGARKRFHTMLARGDIVIGDLVAVDSPSSMRDTDRNEPATNDP